MKDILKKLKIDRLNPMQEEAALAIENCPEVVILSPTGSGKTLAFLLPIIATLDPDIQEVQVLIVVPSRELAIQIEQVARQMGSGFKVNAVYGGRAGSKDKMEIKHRPAILIGTPGRVAAHLRNENFSKYYIRTLVLDEFDKSLEIGFEGEMKEITTAVNKVNKKILTSATYAVDVPGFIQLKDPVYVNYLEDGIPQLSIRTVVSPIKDKLETLVDLICHLGPFPGIIFCNFKDSIKRVSEFLSDSKIDHCVFHGGLEQIDRERALIKFRNGTHQLMLATDLAARGLDIPEIRFIIHYHLPPRRSDFVHRNGRTARMNKDGTAYLIKYMEDDLPEFITKNYPESRQLIKMNTAGIPPSPTWKTLFISGGRKDKISKGDVAGFFMKVGQLTKDEIGIIELKQDCAFVAVHTSKVVHVLDNLNNKKLKTRKVRIHVI